MATDWNGDSRRVKVVLDTNALMMPAQFGVDLFSGLTELLGAYAPLVPAEVVYELRGLSNGCGKNQAAARFGLTVAARCEVLPEWNEEIPVDDKVVKNAQEFNALVVTNDKALRKKLLEKKIPVIILRSRSRLEIIGNK